MTKGDEKLVEELKAAARGPLIPFGNPGVRTYFRLEPENRVEL